MSINLHRRANRVTGYLNDLLEESFPEEAKDYEVVSQEVDEYLNEVLGPPPIKVNWPDEPTYEFYLKPRNSEEPRVEVMILHRPDLNARIVGGIKNEKKHFYIHLFRDNLEKAIQKLESTAR